MKVIICLFFLFLVMISSSFSQDYCLRFYGNGVNDIDRVKIPIDNEQKLINIGGSFTIEFELKYTLSENPLGSSATQGSNDDWTLGHIILDRDIFGPGDYGDYGISLAAGRLCFGVNNGSQSYTIITNQVVPENTWNTIAVTRNQTSGEMRIFINGVLITSYSNGPTGNISYRLGRATSYQNDPFLVIGAEKHDYNNTQYPSFSGFLDNIRISNIIRYSSNYQVSSYSADSSTVAFYDFNEGTGDTVYDGAYIGVVKSHGIRKFGGTPAGPVYVLKSQASFNWFYSFGNGIGSFSSGASTNFLPQPESGEDRVRVGNQGGSFNLENQNISFGNGVYLRGVAPTGTDVNKFSIYSINNPTNLFTMRFLIRLGNSDGSNTATSGNWYLFIGNGSSFSNNNAFNGTETFSGLRWTFSSGGNISTDYRNGDTWSALSPSPFAQGSDYIVDIYCNNSSITNIYTYNSNYYSVAQNKFDLWVNGILVGDDLNKAQITNNATLNSFMFYGENSVSNVANIFLDNIYYTNGLSDEPLPIELLVFNLETHKNQVKLFWQTLTETNNYGFEIERKYTNSLDITDSHWQKIGFVKGYANSNSPKNYSFIDKNLLNGFYSYRLKQIDSDGKFTYSDELKVKVDYKSQVLELKNYPNPFNPITKLYFEIPEDGFITLKIYDILGKEIRTLINENKLAGAYEIEFDASGLTSGIYFNVLQVNNKRIVNKMQLLK